MDENDEDRWRRRLYLYLPHW